MKESYYEANPVLNEYFLSLPLDIQQQLNELDQEISTLGELMLMAEHLKNPPY